MVILIVVSFLFAAVIILWSAKVVVLDAKAGNRGKFSYIAVTVIVAFATYWATCYEYFLDANTRVQGWPVPVVIFQRDNAASPWLDFIGPTLILGMPMNFVIFMLIPSLVFLSAATWRDWHFRLRTLLIATTLVAVVLGLVVAVLRWPAD